MLRFVLLYHRCPPDYARPSHWDFMLESGDMLRTWALATLPRDWHPAHLRTLRDDANCPRLAPANEIEAMQLADHRRAYLDYEGALSGQRGSVSRVAEGSYRVQGEAADCIKCRLECNSLEGFVTLRRESRHSDQWALTWSVSNSDVS